MKMYRFNAYAVPLLRVTLLCLVVFSLATSCVTNKKMTYLQEMKDSEISTEPYIPVDYRIQISDNLFIRVTTPDPRFSEMFNTLPVAAATVSSTEQSVDLLSYHVQVDGTVDIPYLGAVHVEGKTLNEAKVILQNELVDYITDAAITVKLVNNYLSILGEVTRPGLYPIYKKHLNIFQALSMAGDVDMLSARYNVSIIRSTPDGSVVKEFDLRDRNVIDSEFYYVMPNDVIYVKPMKGRFWAFSEFPYIMLLSTITTFILVLNYIQ